MKIPRWKKWLSYLSEIPLESCSSPHNEQLNVLLKNGRFQLCTENAIYSYDDLYDNFTRTFKRLQLSDQNIESVLLLGLGLGSIPFTLERIFDQSYHYTAIEIDEVITELAHRYNLQYLESPIEVICTDARVYLDQTEDTFDLICMDIFQDDKVPEDLEELYFLQQLKDRLNPNGWLLYNRLSLNQDDEQQTADFFENAFRVIFPQATYLDVKTNWILINKSLPR